jgi:uncharacterized cupin superfamily protein
MITWPSASRRFRGAGSLPMRDHVALLTDAAFLGVVSGVSASQSNVSSAYESLQPELERMIRILDTELADHRILTCPQGRDRETHMSKSIYPIAINGSEATARTRLSSYPEPFASRMSGRMKHPLGDLFGLTNFGVNLTRLAPNAISALRHAHTKQDEFIYILQGHPTLRTDESRTLLSPGMCAGFKAGTGIGHHLINETSEEVVYLEVGDRTPGDEGNYPDDDLKALLTDGKWKFVHKNGMPY